MKKTITRQDGTTVTIEGSPEEIAEYEKSLKKPITEAPPAKKEILKGSPVERIGVQEYSRLQEMFRKMQEEESKKPWWERQRIADPVYPKITSFPVHGYDCPIAVAQRGAWMCILPPVCNCGAEPQLFLPYKITFTSNSADKLTFANGPETSYHAEAPSEVKVTNEVYLDGQLVGYRTH